MNARSFITLFLVAAAVLAAGIMIALAVLDPYDRGHGLFARRGTLEGGPRTANVSRGRNPDFNAAIIGNSHVQLLKPERLNGETGLSWVQLSVPATQAREQFVMLDWFARNHRDTAAAVVIGTDYRWCTADAAVAPLHPFPFWLYDADPLVYYPGLFRMQAVRVLPRRIAFLVGRAKARVADGFWDYEAYRTRNEERLWKDAAEARTYTSWNDTGKFPWIDRLATELKALPARVGVVLVTPPHFFATMPPAGTDQARAERACAGRLAEVARNRPRTALVDLRGDQERFRDPKYFWDTTHFTTEVAQAVEADIAAALRAMK